MTIWMGNAGVFERNREECEEQAERAERAGNAADAADWRERAGRWLRQRDDEQRREEDRRFKRSVFRRY
jgi:hypothetical protein